MSKMILVIIKVLYYTLRFKNFPGDRKEIHIIKYIWSFNIWGFQGGDYEDCSFMEYKNPVRKPRD
jgi:hypothetical protein